MSAGASPGGGSTIRMRVVATGVYGADGRLVGTFVSPQAYTMVSGGWGVM